MPCCRVAVLPRCRVAIAWGRLSIAPTGPLKDHQKPPGGHGTSPEVPPQGSNPKRGASRGAAVSPKPPPDPREVARRAGFRRRLPPGAAHAARRPL